MDDEARRAPPPGGCMGPPAMTKKNSTLAAALVVALVAPLLAAAPALAEVKRAAVLEFNGEVDVKTLQLLSDEARAGVLDAVRDRGVQVMTRENTLALLKEMGRCDASEGNCEVET